MKFICSLLFVALIAHPARAQGGKKGIWTDPQDPSLPASFEFQGEYLGEIDRGGKKQKIGCQVIALGTDQLQAVLLPGGLPGAGWDGENKMLMDGKVDAAGGATLVPSEGKKNYISKNNQEFSATKQFPPVGHEPCSATIKGGKLSGKTAGGHPFALTKTVRKSPTLGAAAPAGATVLFDGSNKDAWRGGRIDEKTKLLNTDSKDIHSVKGYPSYKIHVEFMLPFRPDARGQGRGNSGFYQSNGLEVQVLDSFGLEGFNNECGGIYKRAVPKVNMCFPPLTWQTYDVEMTREGDKSFLTVHHNGVLIHDKVEGGGGGARHFTLQGHGNPLQYRNIWIEEK